MVFNFMSSYLMYFYTDVAGVAVGTAGAVMSAARLIDAAANPVVGVLSDKTSTRWGKMRPYLLFSAVPLALSVVMMFLASWVPAESRGIYALITYMLFSLLYTICNVPYSAMMPNISEEASERGKLNLSRMLLANLGSLISMGFAISFAAFLGQGNEQQGFFRLAICFAVVIITLVLFCFFNTKERINPPPAPFSLKTLGKTAKKSKPWVLFCAVQFFHFLATTVRNSTAMYYAKYELGNEEFAGVLLAVSSFTSIGVALIVPLLTKKFKKRSISILGYVLFALGALSVYWAGTNLAAVFLFNLTASIGFSLASGVSFLILGETIDHSEYTTGIRQQGLFTSMYMFMVKLGVVFSSVVSPFVLSLGGYTAGESQTPEALMAIKVNFIFLPFVISLVCVVLLLFYKLDDEYPAINAALRKKRGEE